MRRATHGLLSKMHATYALLKIILGWYIVLISAQRLPLIRHKRRLPFAILAHLTFPAISTASLSILTYCKRPSKQPSECLIMWSTSTFILRAKQRRRILLIGPSGWALWDCRMHYTNWISVLIARRLLSFLMR